MTWKKSPVHFVSAVSATTAYRLHVIFAFRFADNDTEVIPALGTVSGEVDSHSFQINSPRWAIQPVTITHRFQGITPPASEPAVIVPFVSRFGLLISLLAAIYGHEQGHRFLLWSLRFLKYPYI